jgi:SAM-dependent methyltransferase
MGRDKLDTRAVGLDVGLSFVRWLTGAEHLHYGLWDGLEVTAGNLRRAQDAYSVKLFALLPARQGLRILDVGGGAGETAKKLLALGHQVDIVVPSAFLASRCRINAPQARVHEMRFEDFTTDAAFDVCLFSESFQYIPLKDSLSKARDLLAPGGEVLISDCFRSDAFRRDKTRATVGGGHPWARFREAVAMHGLVLLSEQDVTASVAPSIDLEQALFHVFGHGLSRIDDELARTRPTRWKMARFVIDRFVGPRQRVRLTQRFFERTRTSETFALNNRYVMARLGPQAAAAGRDS